MELRRKLVAGSVVALAVVGAGGAVAASKLGTPREESQAVLDDAAKQLGLQPSELVAALKKALANRVDEAVKDGRLTEAEGDALKARINSSEFPFIGVAGAPGFGFGRHAFGLIEPIDPMKELSTVAGYLGLTDAQLRSQLNGGKTLAQIAGDQGKSVDGLIDKLVAMKKERIESAVQDGRLTQAQADEMLAHVTDAVTDFVRNGRLHIGLHEDGPRFDRRPFRFHEQRPDHEQATGMAIA
jgi:hypothetical protein